MTERHTSNGKPLELSPVAFGELRASNDCLSDNEHLRGRMEEDGYLFLRGFIDQDLIRNARRAVLEVLAGRKGILDENHPAMEAKCFVDFDRYVADAELAHLPAVRQLVEAEAIIRFYGNLLKGNVKLLNYTMTRVVGRGRAEKPHCDIVYMGRGTPSVYTSWVPLMDIPQNGGALMVLERSHRLESLMRRYWSIDADKATVFGRNIRYKHGSLVRGGRYSKDATRVQKEFGLRWLTTDFREGDLIIFSARTMHCTLDNRSDRVRLSCDARFQLASQPFDERWNSENPSVHTDREMGILDYIIDAYLRVRDWTRGREV